MSNTNQKKMLETLCQSTMSLIASFYPMSAQVKGMFCDMLSFYEDNPTSETAKKLFDYLSLKESLSVKAVGLKALSANLKASARILAKKKYLDEKNPVPAGLPASILPLRKLRFLPCFVTDMPERIFIAVAPQKT